MSESSYRPARRRVVDGQPRPPPNGHVSGRTWGLPLSGRQKTRPISPAKGAGYYSASRGLHPEARDVRRSPPQSMSLTARPHFLYWPSRISSVCVICTEQSFGLSSPQVGHVGLQNRVGHSYMARGRQLYTLLARPMT
jgi:hypothetical protein